MAVMVRNFIFISLLLFFQNSFAVWQIDSSESKFTFTGTQNNAAVSGEFKSFHGENQFDPNQLASSKINIVVDTSSVMTSYGAIADTLKMTDFLDVKKFPQAVFKSESFSKIKDQSYQAKGLLTIRDKTLPVTVDFDVLDYSATKMTLKGSMQIKRTQFGLGQGEWASTDDLKDEVTINFLLITHIKN